MAVFAKSPFFAPFGRSHTLRGKLSFMIPMHPRTLQLGKDSRSLYISMSVAERVSMW
jgi:hypothetical protein